MKNLIFILLFFIFQTFHFSILKAQNLVPNPGFEEKNECPYSLNQIKYTKYWVGSKDADYFNSCDSIVNDTINYIWVGVPQNKGGYQYAHSGNAYAGMYFFWFIYNNYSEYLEVKLKDSLIANVKYCISFYVSLADSESYAIDAIEAYLSTDSTSTLSNQTLPYHPQISNYGHGIISDKTNWHLISGNFVAQGGEKYITIGNFRLKDSLNYINTGTGIEDLAYYYIDDVSVIACLDTIGIAEMVGNEIIIEIFPNPGNNNITIETPYQSTINISNIQGQLLKTLTTTGTKTNVDVSEFPSGVYIVEVKTEKGIAVKKFIKE